MHKMYYYLCATSFSWETCMSLIGWLENGQEDPRVPFGYREFQRLLRQSSFSTRGGLFIEFGDGAESDAHSIGQWRNIGDQVRGEFFSFGLVPSDAKNPTPALLESLRCEWESSRCRQGQRLHFATMYELVYYRRYRGEEYPYSDFFALGTYAPKVFDSGVRDASLPMASKTELLQVVDAYELQERITTSTRYLCVITNE